mmetsp:Transcript_29297/g.39009  ORF Transcript_29297/g.39009 Transcript_29297/m.39009 type:complete len:337 (+) Transcript_29297:611-1621(+)
MLSNRSGDGTPKFKKMQEEGLYRNLSIDDKFLLRGIRKADYDILVKMGLNGNAKFDDVDIEGGYEMLAGKPNPMGIVAVAPRASEPVPDRKRDRQAPFRQSEMVSCGSEAGSALSQDTVTDSLLSLRRRVAEKRGRALRRLRGIINIAKVWKQSVKKPHIKRFQKAVRRYIYSLRWYRYIIRNRRYPIISNERATKAIYRLMMLVRMKLRNTEAGAWREKWLRAKRRVRGIINIMSIVKRERRERIERLYNPEESSESYYDEAVDQMTELDPIDERGPLDPLNSSTRHRSYLMQPLTGNLRGSALALSKNNTSIINTHNRPSNLSQGNPMKSVRQS